MKTLPFSSNLFVRLAAIGLVVLALSFVWAAIGSNTGASSRLRLPAEPMRYSDPSAGIELLYPSTWSIHETPQGQRGDKEVELVILGPVESTTWIFVAMRENMPRGDISAVAQWGLERIQTQKNVQLGSIEYTQDASQKEMALIDYTWRYPASLFSEVTLHCRDVYKERNTTAFALTMCTQDRYWDTVEEVFLVTSESFTVSHKPMRHLKPG